LDINVTARFTIDLDKHDLSLGIDFQFEGGSSGTSTGGIGRSYDRSNEYHKFYEGASKPAKVDEETREAWNVVKRSESYYFGRQLFDLRKPLKRGALLDGIIGKLEDNEPLKLLSSWPVLQAADQNRLNVVAILPDELIEWPFNQPIDDVTPVRDYFRRMWPPPSARYDEALKCWLIAPDDRPQARKDRVDRPAFARLLRSLDARGWATLDDMADYVIRSGAESIGQGWSTLMAVARQADVGEGSQSWGYDIGIATRIYAAIPAVQRKQAWAGGAVIPAEHWSPQLMRLLREHDWDEFRFTRPDADLFEFPYGDGRLVSSVLRSPLPRGSVLRVVAKREPVVWIGIRETESAVASDLDRAGHILANVDQGEEQSYRPDRLAEGVRETLTVEFDVPGVGIERATSLFSSVPFVGDLRPLDKLPPWIQSLIKESVRRAREGGGLTPRPRL
jgi:hypothetical protein